MGTNLALEAEANLNKHKLGEKKYLKNLTRLILFDLQLCQG